MRPQLFILFSVLVALIFCFALYPKFSIVNKNEIVSNTADLKSMNLFNDANVSNFDVPIQAYVSKDAYIYRIYYPKYLSSQPNLKKWLSFFESNGGVFTKTTKNGMYIYKGLYDGIDISVTSGFAGGDPCTVEAECSYEVIVIEFSSKLNSLKFINNLENDFNKISWFKLVRNIELKEAANINQDVKTQLIDQYKKLGWDLTSWVGEYSSFSLEKDNVTCSDVTNLKIPTTFKCSQELFVSYTNEFRVDYSITVEKMDK